MPENEKARSGGDPDQAREREKDFCQTDYSTETMKFEGRISQYLSSGRENALHASELSLLTGLESREIRLAVEQERRQGTPILSSNDGYYLPGDRLETVTFIKSMRQRGRSCIVTAEAVARATQGDSLDDK